MIGTENGRPTYEQTGRPGEAVDDGASRAVVPTSNMGHRGDLYVPEIEPDADTLTAALTYARAGLCVLPVRKGSKNPGSVVGRNWQSKSSHDPKQIVAWLAGTDYGIALHVGRSGTVVFDVDKPELRPPELLAAIDNAPYQSTRANQPGRGHYVFLMPEGRKLGNGTGKLGKGWGEVRGRNGVIVVAPSVHPNAAEGGRYRWECSGTVPPLPDAVATLLDDSAGNGDAATNAQANQFLNTHTSGSPDDGRLRAVLEVYDRKVAQGASRHQTAVEAACWAMREAKRGYYPARTAGEELGKRFMKSLTGEKDRSPVSELHGIIAWAIGQAMIDSVFTYMGPVELAQPAKTVEFLITGVLARDTFGPNAGPKKSLKTHTNQAIGVAVASGRSLFGFDKFNVPKAGAVLYIVGEGGENSYRRSLQRIASAYDVNVGDLPIHALFGAAPLNDSQFLDELKRYLDRVQPDLVILESFYNFHPVNVETGNLYVRGRLIADYHREVQAEVPGCTSILTDHFRSTNNRGLDLDTISQAGQAESADSWILQQHRKPPNLSDGEFQLLTEFGSRQGFNRRWEIDWHLGPFDDELGMHVGEIGWDVREASECVGTENRNDETKRGVLAVVDKHPFELTKTEVVSEVGRNAAQVNKAIKELEQMGKIEKRSKPRPEGARSVTRKLWGRTGVQDHDSREG